MRGTGKQARGWVAADRCCARKNHQASVGIAWYQLPGCRRKSYPSGRRFDVSSKTFRAATPSQNADPLDPNRAKKWKRAVSKRMGVTLKRLFSTGPAALKRLQRCGHYTESLRGHEPITQATYGEAQGALSLPAGRVGHRHSRGPCDQIAKDHYYTGHSPAKSAYAALIAEGGRCKATRHRKRCLGAAPDIGQRLVSRESILNKNGEPSIPKRGRDEITVAFARRS